jgi:hypothetical protein
MIMNRADLERLGELIEKQKCPHGYPRHRLDGGMAPGCSECVDERIGTGAPKAVTIKVTPLPLSRSGGGANYHRPVPTTAFSSVPTTGALTCGRCMGVFETAGAAAEHDDFECEANQARGIR